MRQGRRFHDALRHDHFPDGSGAIPPRAGAIFFRRSGSATWNFKANQSQRPVAGFPIPRGKVSCSLTISSARGIRNRRYLLMREVPERPRGRASRLPIAPVHGNPLRQSLAQCSRTADSEHAIESAGKPLSDRSPRVVGKQADRLKHADSRASARSVFDEDVRGDQHSDREQGCQRGARQLINRTHSTDPFDHALIHAWARTLHLAHGS